MPDPLGPALIREIATAAHLVAREIPDDYPWAHGPGYDSGRLAGLAEALRIVVEVLGKVAQDNEKEADHG